MMQTLTQRFLPVAAVMAVLSAPVAVFGQAAATTSAALHGHVTSVAATPLQGGDIKLTTDRTQPSEAKFAYDFPIGQTGDYTGKDIAPGDYVAYVVQNGKFVDRAEIKLTAGADSALDFDMSREDYLKSLSPEERKQIEDYKKTAAKANADNAVIANLNKTLTDVRADIRTPNPNFDKDAAEMKAATASKPEEGLLWMTYGEVLSAQGDSLAAADKKAGKPASSDDAVQKAYTDATDAFQKGIDLNVASKKPSAVDQATAYNQMGSTYAHAGNVEKAEAAYEKAATLAPANAAMYYGNEAAILYNASQTNSALGEAALRAADKAIAADPDKPDPYYVKAQILLQKATVDPKTQKVVLPDGCEDAYQHYLSLAPDGKFAPSVKEILAGLNIKINTSYRASHKR